MDVRRWRRFLLAALGAATLSCSAEKATEGAGVTVPENLAVEAVGMTTVKLSWSRPAGGSLTGYEIQRRADLTGPFVTIARNVPAGSGRMIYFDTKVEPETYYGYRVIAISTLGQRSGPSTVGGTKTPPAAGLVIRVLTQAVNDSSVDPDGYTVAVAGPRDTVSVPLGTNAERRISPLHAGPYTLVMRGLAKNCGFSQGDSLRVATVNEEGTETLTRVTYDVSCRDSRRGSIVIRYEQDGDTTDPNGVRLAVTGQLDPDPSDTAKVYFDSRRLNNRVEAFRYDNLRTGAYEVSIEDLDSVCRIVGQRKRTVTVKQLSVDSLRFQATCDKQVAEDTVGKPFVLTHKWTPTTVSTNAKVALAMELNVSAQASASVSGVQANFTYPSAVLRYDSARVGEFDLLTANGRNAGLVIFAAANTDGTGRSGKIAIGKIWFTVLGQTGAIAKTSTTLTEVLSPQLAELKAQIRVQEATLAVGTQGNANQKPVAKANGPYSATLNLPIRLSATGSADPDGNLVAYEWDFGDGTQGTGDAPTHTYGSEGSFTATLTVRDDAGATATDVATVTVRPNGNNVAPIARITVPAALTATIPADFSGATSTDADGTIVNYAWDFGDGATGSGVTVSHAFAQAGTYQVKLVVRDNSSATGTAQQSVTVSPVSGGVTKPTWNSGFAPIAGTNDVELAVTLDLSADIPETTGPEALQSYVVDSLKWNPAVLQLVAFNFGPGQSQSIDHSDVARGKVVFSGSAIASNASGLVTIARIRLRMVGASGTRTTTATALGAVLSSPATGAFNYRPKIELREGTVVVP